MPEFALTPETLAMIAGIIISLLFSYIPGLNVKFAALAPEVKRLIMLGILLAISAAAVGLACGNIIVITGFVCNQAGITTIVWSFILAVIANQSIYSISPQLQRVRLAASGDECGD